MGENPALVLEKAVMARESLTYAGTVVLNAQLRHWSFNIARGLEMAERGMHVGKWDPNDSFQPDHPLFSLTQRMFGNLYYQARYEEHGFGP